MTEGKKVFLALILLILFMGLTASAVSYFEYRLNIKQIKACEVTFREYGAL